MRVSLWIYAPALGEPDKKRLLTLTGVHCRGRENEQPLFIWHFKCPANTLRRNWPKKKNKNKEAHKCFDLKWQKDCPVKVKPLCVSSASVERLPNN